MHIRQPLSWLFVVFTFFAFCSVSAASLTPPQQIIQDSSDKIKQTLVQPSYKNDFGKATGYVDGVVSQFVDMNKVAILVLGKNIRQANAAQRQQFIKEFKTLLVRTYTKAFLEYNDWRISFDPSLDASGQNKTVVRTLVHQPGQQPVNINYRMMQNKQGEWKVYDILIEGVSLVTNYRTTFNREIAQTGSIDSVINMLIERNRR
ncbi:MAG: hypothetical protein Kow0065_01490 [Methylomicrobium sp.]